MQLPPEDPFEDSISVMQFCRLFGRLLFFALCTFTEHHKLRFKQRTVWYTLHRQHTQRAVMFCLVHKVLWRAVVSLQSCFEIHVLLIGDKCPLLRIYENKKKNAKFSTLSLYSFFFFFFFAIAKISTREIRLSNIRKIKFARKLVRIRYMTFTREYPPTMLKTYFTSHYYYKKMAWVSCIFACSYSPSHPFPLVYDTCRRVKWGEHGTYETLTTFP